MEGVYYLQAHGNYGEWCSVNPPVLFTCLLREGGREALLGKTWSLGKKNFFLPFYYDIGFIQVS